MIKFATFLLAFTTMSPLVSASPLPAETDYVDFNKPFTVNITALCDDSCLDSHEKDWRITGEIPGSGGVMRVTTYSDYLEPKRPEDPEGPEDPEDSVPYRKVGEVRFDNATDVEDRVFFVDRDLNASEKDDIAIGKTVVDNRHWKVSFLASMARLNLNVVVVQRHH